MSSGWQRTVAAAHTRQGGHVKLTAPSYRERAKASGAGIGNMRPLNLAEHAKLREAEGTKLTPAQIATLMLKSHGYDRNGNKIQPKAPRTPKPAPIRYTMTTVSLVPTDHAGTAGRTQAKPKHTPRESAPMLAPGTIVRRLTIADAIAESRSARARAHASTDLGENR